MTENPYASPSAAAAAVAPPSEVEAIRNQYLNHEASVKSIGTLYMLGAIFLVPISLFMIIGGLTGNFAGEVVAENAVMIVIGVLYLGLGIAQGVTAIGLRKLQPWARIVASIFSVIGLSGIPVGTLICAYFLYLLLSKKGSFVFSEEYKRVIEATPHIKYRTPIIVIILLALLLFLVFGGMIAFLISG